MSCLSRQSWRKFSSFTNDLVQGAGKGSEFHGSAARNYPNAAVMKLPDNFQDINASEIGQFSPLRSREISGSVMSSSFEGNIEKNTCSKIDITVDSDPHVEPYDCRGAVSLSSSMQSNVPSPFGGQRCILGMPGSQWGQGYKYLSDYLHHSHYLNLRNSCSRALHSVSLKKGIVHSYHTVTSDPTNKSFRITNVVTAQALRPSNTTSYIRNMSNDESSVSGRKQSSEEKSPGKDDSKLPTRAEQLKRAVAAYGSTVIVFHITISLMSLGSFYLLVNSGLDVMYYIEYMGLADGALSKKITANTGTFVLAYAIHKVFAPARIAITLTATPFIVRYLRKVGILKAPVKVN